MEALHGIALGKNLAPLIESHFPNVVQNSILLLCRQFAEQGQAGDDEGNIGVLNDDSPAGSTSMAGERITWQIAYRPQW
ncbi:MAG TPA: hypothetical protein VL968_02895 [Rhodocyclaceae bacterium]|nr:hypothetical protein [Rhodocyclaceae bacterium]